jgi:hypothetical protein
MDTLTLDLWAWTLGDDTDGWVLLSGSTEWRLGDASARDAAAAQVHALLRLCERQFGPPDDEAGDWSYALDGLAAQDPPGMPSDGWQGAQLDLRLHEAHWAVLSETCEWPLDDES